MHYSAFGQALEHQGQPGTRPLVENGSPFRKSRSEFAPELSSLEYRSTRRFTAAALAIETSSAVGKRIAVGKRTKDVTAIAGGAPIDETMPQAPINPFGASKLMVERMLSKLPRSPPPAVCGSVIPQRHRCGPRYIREDHGSRDSPHGPRCRLRDREAVPRVFGADYQTDDGTCVRDFIHVIELSKGPRAGVEGAGAGVHVPGLQSGKWIWLRGPRSHRMGRARAAVVTILDGAYYLYLDYESDSNGPSTPPRGDLSRKWLDMRG